MKRSVINRTMSLALILVMLFSIASCGKKNSGKKGRTISSDDPWFDARIYSMKLGLNTGGKEISFRTQELAGADDDYIVVFTKGYYVTPGGDYYYSDYTFHLVTVVDRNTGSRINTIDLNQYISGNGFIQDVDYYGGKITSVVYKEEDEKGGYNVEIDTDILTGEKLDERALSGPDQDYMGIGKFRVGKYNIRTHFIYGDFGTPDPHVQLKIFSSEGEEYCVELMKERTDLWYVPVILPLDEDKILVPFTQTSTNIPAFFEVDIKNEKAVEVDSKDYGWIDFSKIRKGFGSNDGRAYFSTTAGISRIDMQNKKIEEVFSYNSCPISNTVLSETQIVDCYDGSIVLLGDSDIFNSYSLEGSSNAGIDIFIINKAAQNPNAGKTVLELYAANGYIDPTVSEAMVRFNETNEEYFVEYTNRYKDSGVHNFLQTDTLDDVANWNLQNNLLINDQLAMDIMNGEGPDILLLRDDMGRLCYPNCLADMSSYFDDLDPEKYYVNVVDAAKTDGRLYQLPLTFSIKGIHTDSKYAGASGIGFTTKEYEDFLYGPLNGCDLNPNGQTVYFTDLFNAMREKFLSNGKADFSGPEFSELAEFVKNNVREKAPLVNESDDFIDDSSNMNDRVARLETYTCPISYLAGVNQLHGADAMLGVPSADGRGPAICSTLSVAVSSQAVNTDACVDFAKTLLTEEVQYKMAISWNFTLSRDAYKKSEGVILDFCNGPRGKDVLAAESYGAPDGAGRNRMTFTEENLSDLEKIILSCSHFDSADASINIILTEEMPPYFLGQKDLDEVIKIAQDRVQKVLDER